MQIEQLQSISRLVGLSLETSKRTVPQWQPPRYVGISVLQEVNTDRDFMYRVSWVYTSVIGRVLTHSNQNLIFLNAFLNQCFQYVGRFRRATCAIYTKLQAFDVVGLVGHGFANPDFEAAGLDTSLGLIVSIGAGRWPIGIEILQIFAESGDLGIHIAFVEDKRRKLSEWIDR